MGRERAKSADLAGSTWLGARSVTYQDLGRKDGFVRTGRDCATVENSAGFC